MCIRDSLVLFPFLLAMALGQLISGTLSDRFGRKPVLVVSGALFFVFSALCALAPSIGLLVLFLSLIHIWPASCQSEQ